MSNIIVVNGVNVPELPYRGQRVVTFDMVASVHQVNPRAVESSYAKNSQHFIEGKHTYLLKGQELQEFKRLHANSELVISPHTPSLRLFTELGYYKLVKPMGDDVSWQVQDEMAETYFQVSHQLNQPPNMHIEQTPIQIAIQLVGGWKTLAELCGAPIHVALIEASKETRKLGVDITPLLQSSQHMDNIHDDQEMLEPTELAKRLGFSSGRAMNNQLRDMRLQARINGEWAPTDAAAGMFFKHSWTKGSKSGCNLKWNLAKVKTKLEAYTESYSSI